MSGATSPAAPRPWWEPILGVASMGFGGMQAMAGLAFCGIALAGPPAARGAFLLVGAAWLRPGLLLGGAGLLLILRHPRAFLLSAAAAAALALGVAAVAAGRASLPPAVADAGEWGLAHPQCPPWAKRLYERASQEGGSPGFEVLRDPAQAGTSAGVFTMYCCIPLPWCLLQVAGAWAARRGAPSQR